MLENGKCSNHFRYKISEYLNVNTINFKENTLFYYIYTYILQYKMAFSALVYSEKINRLYNMGKWKDEDDNVKVIT